MLAPLNDPTVFAQVEVDELAATLSWPNGVDLDPDVLYGEQVPARGRTPTVLFEYHRRDDS